MPRRLDVRRKAHYVYVSIPGREKQVRLTYNEWVALQQLPCGYKGCTLLTLHEGRHQTVQRT